MARRNADDPVRDAVVRKAARAGELDRYLAALLAPRHVRSDLIALTAFLAEVARVAGIVSEPMMGEIRLQWWREALAGGGADGPTGSPVADAFRQTIERHALPEDLLLSVIEARSRELDGRFPASKQVLEGYFREGEGAAFRLAARILGAGEGYEVDGVLAAAAQAYGRVRLLRSLPLNLAKGRSPLLIRTTSVTEIPDWAAAAAPVLAAAKAWLKEARDRAPTAPAALLPAILPLALVEPYLTALERLGPNIANTRADISPLTRVWRLWRANALGRV